MHYFAFLKLLTIKYTAALGEISEISSSQSILNNKIKLYLIGNEKPAAAMYVITPFFLPHLQDYPMKAALINKRRTKFYSKRITEQIQVNFLMKTIRLQYIPF